MTWPYGEMAGVTTGSKVIGSIMLGQGLSSSWGAASSPCRLRARSALSTPDHLHLVPLYACNFQVCPS